MTAEEMEVAYCKARVTCMKSFRLLIREHLELSEEAIKLKLSYEKVHKLIIAGLTKVESELTDELNKWSKMISERETGSADCIDGVGDEAGAGEAVAEAG